MDGVFPHPILLAWGSDNGDDGSEEQPHVLALSGFYSLISFGPLWSAQHPWREHQQQILHLPVVLPRALVLGHN